MVDSIDVKFKFKVRKEINAVNLFTSNISSSN